MDSVLRAAAIYGILLILMRVMGKRSLAQITTFDFILVLIISEATQQAMIGEDFSVTNAAIVILTLMMIDLGLGLISFRSPRIGKLVNGVPLIVVEDGRPLRDRMDKSRLSDDDVLEEARRSQGIERMEQIKYAVLEKNGNISIIPKPAN